MKKNAFSLKIKEVENRNSPTLIGGESVVAAKATSLCVLCIDLSSSTCTSCDRCGCL